MIRIYLIFLAVLFYVTVSAYGAGSRQVTFTVGAPSSTSYSASDSQSRVAECSGNTVTVYNQTDAVVGVAFGTTSSAPSTDIYFVPPGPNSGIEKKPESSLSSGNYIYIRTPSGAETSGTVEVACTSEAN